MKSPNLLLSKRPPLNQLILKWIFQYLLTPIKRRHRHQDPLREHHLLQLDNQSRLRLLKDQRLRNRKHHRRAEGRQVLRNHLTRQVNLDVSRVMPLQLQNRSQEASLALVVPNLNQKSQSLQNQSLGRCLALVPPSSALLQL
jgi:hypothetical protein